MEEIAIQKTLISGRTEVTQTVNDCHYTGYHYLKRFFDIILSATALVVLSPVFVIVAIAIKAEDHGPVIHKRYCIGKNNTTYIMYKFRSMKENADDLICEMKPEKKELYLQGVKLMDDPRVTKTGTILRRTSIDELPQLISVLKGEMSLVGPRPVIEREAKAYGDSREQLFRVRPGITGIWQTEGRGEVPFLSQEAIAMQLSYVEKMSFSFDLKIMLQTVLIVLKRKGAR